jgi:hypothetical protein
LDILPNESGSFQPGAILTFIHDKEQMSIVVSAYMNKSGSLRVCMVFYANTL